MHWRAVSPVACLRVRAFPRVDPNLVSTLFEPSMSSVISAVYPYVFLDSW